MLISIITFSISLLITLLLIPKILLTSIEKRLLDIPDKRKVHMVTSSRLGGIAFFPGIILPSLIIPYLFCKFGICNTWEQVTMPWFVIGIAACFIMYIVGIADDITGVRYRVKLVYQIVTAILIVCSGADMTSFYDIFGIEQMPLWIGIPIAIGLIIWIINALNLIDGIDGLASGLSIIILFFYGIAFCFREQVMQVLFSFATIGTLIPFFIYNIWGVKKYTSHIFMGDSGALLVGTIISILAIQLIDKHSGVLVTDDTHFYTIVAFSVLIVPCFDVVRVILHRLRFKQPIFLPDKNHIHHKFIRLGYSPRQTLVLLLAMSVAFIGLSILLNTLKINITIIVVVDVAIWSFTHIILTKKIKRERE